MLGLCRGRCGEALILVKWYRYRLPGGVCFRPSCNPNRDLWTPTASRSRAPAATCASCACPWA
eukprot:42038-Eustigmatos_ZCMA.PRE.1